MPEYQYKDHLGNLRVSFRDQEDEVFNATIESNATTNGQPENMVFDFIDQTRDGTQKRTDLYSSKLTQAQPIGMWKSLPVTKGDKVTVEVYGKYVSPPTNNNISLIPFINPLPATMPASEGNNNPTWLSAGLIAFPVSYSTSPSVPKSYLRGQFFDKEGNFVRAVPVVPLSSGSAWQLMTFDFEAEIEGTLQIFVANESDAPVWYDDMEITWDKALIAQENHYYPFGMNLVGIEKQGMPDNLWQFQGQEKIKDFNLNWSSFKWRNADVQLGRFFSVDPLAEDYLYNSVYAFSENNVTAHIELEGLEKVFFMKARSKNFDKVYKIQRQTSGGQRFFSKLKSQSEYNVLYFQSGLGEGVSTSISKIDDFKKLKKNNSSTFVGVTEEAVSLSLEKDKKLILVGVAYKLTDKEELNEATYTLNHEEFHAESTIDGNKGVEKEAEDHGKYYDEKSKTSPNDKEVKSDSKYSKSKANKQYKEIDKIIENEKNVKKD